MHNGRFNFELWGTWAPQIFIGPGAAQRLQPLSWGLIVCVAEFRKSNYVTFYNCRRWTIQAFTWTMQQQRKVGNSTLC